MRFASPLARRSNIALVVRIVHAAAAVLRDTATSPFVMVTNQRSVFVPFVRSKRTVAVTFCNSSSWPRRVSSPKNSVVASAMAAQAYRR